MSDGRQSEVDFLHRWAVAWLKLSGKSSSQKNSPYKRTETQQYKFVGVKAYEKGEGLTSGWRASLKDVLAWPMAERQIGHRKSSLVLFARFPVVKWRSRSVAKSAAGL